MSADGILLGFMIHRKSRQFHGYHNIIEVNSSTAVRTNFILESIVIIPTAKCFRKACIPIDLVTIANGAAVLSVLGYYCVSTSGKLIDKSIK